MQLKNLNFGDLNERSTQITSSPVSTILNGLLNYYLTKFDLNKVNSHIWFH